MKLKKFTQKDRYGNTMSYEYESDTKPLDPTALMKAQMEQMQGMIPPPPVGGEEFVPGNPMSHPGEPKGEDTVPAWLTPGEFVVNAEAMSIPENAQMVEAINNQGRAMQQGGGVEYARAGKAIKQVAKEYGTEIPASAIMGADAASFMFNPGWAAAAYALNPKEMGSATMWGPGTPYIDRDHYLHAMKVQDSLANAQYTGLPEVPELEGTIAPGLTFNEGGEVSWQEKLGFGPEQMELVKGFWQDPLNKIPSYEQYAPEVWTKFVQHENDGGYARYAQAVEDAYSPPAVSQLQQDIYNSAQSNMPELVDKEMRADPVVVPKYDPSTGEMSLKLGIEGYFDDGGMVPMMPDEALLRQREGYRDDVYLDSMGKPTVGHGHLLPNEYKDRIGEQPFSGEELDEMFSEDREKAQAAAQRNVGPAWDNLNRQQQAALTSMAFQLGPTGQAKFKNMLAAIKAGDNREVARQALTGKKGGKSAWLKQTPQRAMDLAMAFDPDVAAQYKNAGGTVYMEAGGDAMAELVARAQRGDAEALRVLQDSVGSQQKEEVAPPQYDDRIMRAGEALDNWTMSPIDAVTSVPDAIDTVMNEVPAPGGALEDIPPSIPTPIEAVGEIIVPDEAPKLKTQAEIDRDSVTEEEKSGMAASNAKADALRDIRRADQDAKTQQWAWQVLKDKADEEEADKEAAKAKKQEEARVMMQTIHKAEQQAKKDGIGGPAGHVAGNKDFDINNPDFEAKVEAAGKAAGGSNTTAATSLMQDIFGDLFDKKELARMAIMYAGSRALGYDHGGSLSWAAKNYVNRVDAKNAANTKFAMDNVGKFTPQSMKAYMKSGDPTVLQAAGVPLEETGKTKRVYRNGKRMDVREVKQGDNVYWVDNKNQPIDQSWNDDASTVPGTPEYSQRIKKDSGTYTDMLKDLRSNFGTIPGGRDQADTYVTDLAPNVAGNKIARWAAENKVRPEYMGSIIENAYHSALEHSQRTGEKVRDLTPFLNEQYVISQVGDSSLFQGISPVNVIKVLSSVDSVYGGRYSRADAIKTYREAWNNLDPKARERYNNSAGKEQNGFMLFIQEDINNKLSGG